MSKANREKLENELISCIKGMSNKELAFFAVNAPCNNELCKFCIIKCQNGNACLSAEDFNTRKDQCQRGIKSYLDSAYDIID